VNEHGFVRAVHGKIAKDLPLAWKINDRFAGGAPDAYYLGPANHLWVEYKYRPEFPVRSTTLLRPDVKPLQVQWHLNSQSCGGQHALVWGVQDRVRIFTNPVLWKELALTKGEFFSNSMSFKEAREWIVNHCQNGKSSS